MGKLDYLIRITALLLDFGLIIYILWANKPIVLIAPLVSIIIMVLSGESVPVNSSTTTIINEDGDGVE